MPSTNFGISYQAASCLTGFMNVPILILFISSVLFCRVRAQSRYYDRLLGENALMKYVSMLFIKRF